jgi:hypothetical protein
VPLIGTAKGHVRNFQFTNQEATMRSLQETYAKWHYAQLTDPLSVSSGGKLLAFLSAEDRQRACEENSLLRPRKFDELISESRSPGLANIGVPVTHPRYAQTRRAWINLALGSIFDEVEELSKNPYYGGESTELLFQTAMILDGVLFFVTVDLYDGITVASASRDTQLVQRLATEIEDIAGKRLEAALVTMRAVAAAFSASR